MLIIPCPLCGPRSENEFIYGGPETTWPKLDGNTNVKDWHKAVHLTPNPFGQHSELWYHASSCESWLVVTRNTITHEIIDACQTSVVGGVK